MRRYVCNTCNTPAPLNCADEPLQSQIENFILSIIGSVTSTNVNGVCVWTLPCDLGQEIPAFPRLPNEGVLCYLYRIIATGAAVGESNVGANVGTGVEIYQGKTGVTLNFRSLVAGLNITLTQNTDDIEISFQYQAVPENQQSPGIQGQVACDGDFWYFCYNTQPLDATSDNWSRQGLAKTWTP